MHTNHPPQPRSMEKLLSTKPVPSAKKLENAALEWLGNYSLVKGKTEVSHHFSLSTDMEYILLVPLKK